MRKIIKKLTHLLLFPHQAPWILSQKAGQTRSVNKVGSISGFFKYILRSNEKNIQRKPKRVSFVRYQRFVKKLTQCRTKHFGGHFELQNNFIINNNKNWRFFPKIRRFREKHHSNENETTYGFTSKSICRKSEIQSQTGGLLEKFCY